MRSLSVMPLPVSARVIRSRITDWDASRGFGFVDLGGRRLFLHHRDFVRKVHPPRQGDSVSFVVGVDEKGRACARAVESLERRSYLRLRHWFGLLILLTIPALVTWNMPWSPWISFTYVVVVSGLSYRDYRYDKVCAQRGIRRVPESTLHLLALIGGWPGGFLARHRFRHKTVKASFRRGFWGIVLLHEAVAVDFLLGWPGLRHLIELTGDLISRLPA